MIKKILFILCSVLVLYSCQKWQDKPAADPHLSNKYCNDPTAVNYNWGFPGTPDNTVCYYPTDVFKGTYTFKDSVYLPDDSLAFVKSYTLNVIAINHVNMAVMGFCGTSDSLKFTAGKYGMATADTNAVSGQFFCRQLDTLTGNLVIDSAGFQISFKVQSDTGYTIHSGQAIKQ